MDAVTILDTLFVFLAAACAAFFLYGGWVCLRYCWEQTHAGGIEHPLIRALKQEAIRRLRSWRGSLVILAATIATLGSPELGATTFEEAMRDYERGDYIRAHTKFRLAAEKGDPRAQEVLGLMYAFGHQLYPGIAQDLRAAGAWLDRAARSGRQAARYAYCALIRKQQPGRAQGWRCFDWIAETGEPPRRQLENISPTR